MMFFACRGYQGANPQGGRMHPDCLVFYWGISRWGASLMPVSGVCEEAPMILPTVFLCGTSGGILSRRVFVWCSWGGGWCWRMPASVDGCPPDGIFCPSGFRDGDTDINRDGCERFFKQGGLFLPFLRRNPRAAGKKRGKAR